MATINVDKDILKNISEDLQNISLLSNEDNSSLKIANNFMTDCNCSNYLKKINETLDYSSGNAIESLKLINKNLNIIISSTKELMQSTSKMINVIADNFNDAEISSMIN